MKMINGIVIKHGIKIPTKKSSSSGIFKKSGRGMKKGAGKIKQGFVWTGQKLKNIFTIDDQQPGWSADSQP